MLNPSCSLLTSRDIILHTTALNRSLRKQCGGEMKEENGWPCSMIGRGKVHTGLWGDLRKWGHLEYLGEHMSELLKFM